MKNNNKIKEKQKKNLYDFDYESEEEKKLKKNYRQIKNLPQRDVKNKNRKQRTSY